MIERRRTTRRRVCLGGRLRIAAFLPEIDCLIGDVSLEGARIRMPPAAVVPDHVDLIVPCRGETRRARVAWRAAGVLGLSFPAAGAPDPDGDEVARLRAALLAGNDREPGSVH